jgi:hypothetical protein
MVAILIGLLVVVQAFFPKSNVNRFQFHFATSNTDGERSWQEKIIESIFFYGLEEPKLKSTLRSGNGKVDRGKIRSLFFTVGEQVGLSYLRERTDSENHDSTSGNTIRNRIRDLDRYIEGLSADLEVIDAEFLTVSDEISPESRAALSARRELLLKALNSAKVEYINLCAESE